MGSPLAGRRVGSQRDYGSAVMYAPGKILMMGGGETPPTNTSEVIDLNQQPSPTFRWTTIPPNRRSSGTYMAVGRRHLNATLLPDGTVLVTGGTSKTGWNIADEPTSAVHNAELWDPTTEKWRTLARISSVHPSHLPL